jgi:hypothetical protein
MTTCKMRQAVRTQSGRAKPVLSRGGGGGSRQIPAQTTLELHSDHSFTNDRKITHPPTRRIIPIFLRPGHQHERPQLTHVTRHLTVYSLMT